MNNFWKLTTEERKNVILQTGIRKNDLFPQVVEKDLWVTTILQIVFSLPFADKLAFKGGTSLSKVWGLIERFFGRY
ncbi:MAG: nucleotidyl transferase AbiEii/AbiGii toxin family protein [Bacteroidales bacterium]|jgi:predicted nucleotidyltransferase component of viral defense system|nr:nucleotidyl transferase AbiEii/AbiGii toxin family protein [Bacteroidales bacterium]